MKLHKILVIGSFVVMLTACNIEKTDNASVSMTTTENTTGTVLDTEKLLEETVEETNVGDITVDIGAAVEDGVEVDVEPVCVTTTETEFATSVRNTDAWATAFASLMCKEFEFYDVATPQIYQWCEDDTCINSVNSPYFIGDCTKYTGSTDGVRCICTTATILDTNLDGVPEIAIHRYTTAETSSELSWDDVYNVDGVLLGTTKLGELWCYNNTVYTYKDSMTYTYMAAVTSEYPFVLDADGCCDANGVWHTIVSVGANATTTQTIESSNTVNFDTVCVEYFSIDGLTLREKGDIVPMVQGAIHVPDPTNYTEEDIYNCLLPLIEEYVAKTQEQ